MKFQDTLKRAAERCGIPTDGLSVIDVTVDHTWGLLVGYAFVGPEALVDRAAKFCVAYHSHDRMPGTYAAQNATMDRGVRTVYVDVKTLHSLGMETQYQQGNAPLTARVVSTTYYAGAE
jgi:hypothetical protein